MKRSFLILGIIVLLVLGMSLTSFGDNQWISIGPGGVTVKAIAINPHTPETLYIGTAGFGVFKSIDGGSNWTPASTGLSNLCVMALAIDLQTPETIYVGTSGGGVFGSVDSGTSWTSISTGFPTSIGVDALAINPLTPETIYAGTGGFCSEFSYGDGAFKSIDGGLTWTAVNTGLLLPGGVTALALNPRTPDILYAGAFNVIFDAPISTGVFKSSDGGATWIATTLPQFPPLMLPPYVFALVIDPQIPQTVYAGTDAGIFKTIDGGTTWTDASSGLSKLRVPALVINPQAPGTLYAGTEGGVFRSSDGAGTWVPIGTDLPTSTVEVLAIDPQTPEILYAGTNGFGVFKIHIGIGPGTSVLTVSKLGTGNGTVISDLPGINCGTTCSGSFNPETVVTLTAAPDSGSVFAGWSGACSGMGACSITMDGDKTAIAVFNLQEQSQFTLTVVKSGTGSGTVSSSPRGINCGTDCSEIYSKVQKVRLTAKPDRDSTFSGWSGGGCSGTGTCEITVDSPTVIAASFMGKIPQIMVSSASIDFDSLQVGKSVTKRLAITNDGVGDLTIVAGGLDGTVFRLSGKASVTIKPNRTIRLSVVFSPTSTEPEVALLKILSNDPDKPVIEVPLTGYGR